MKRSEKFALLVLCVVTLRAQGPPSGGGGHRGFGPGFGIMSAGPGSRTPVTGAPYSATQTTQSQQALADGNRITRQEQSKVYRDTQGRVRIEHTRNKPAASTGETQSIITIFDPVGGYSYVLNPATLTALKTPLPPAHAGREGGPPRRKNGDFNVQTENLAAQIINGVPATGTRVTETIAAGAIGNQQAIQVVRETWVSTDLKVPVLIKTSDPRFGSTVMQLTNIAQAEPDASLFQVPSTYTVEERTHGAGRPGMRPRVPHD